MERRDFLTLAAMTAAPFTGNEPIAAPLHRVVDGITPCAPEHIRRFWDRTWPEAFRDFQRAGVEWQTTDATGEVRRSPGDRPIFIGLRRGVINLVLTDHIPMHWDRGRALAGLATQHNGYEICVLALRYAHPNQFPFLSVNTCVHELLHALLRDIYIDDPKWYQESGHEVRIDGLATQMWLLREASVVRTAAQGYAERVRSREIKG